MKFETFINDQGEWNIIIGQNRHENWQIIDEADPTDIWFHVQEMPSCHVILKNVQKISVIERSVLKRCALLCKMNSKAKTEKKSIIMYTPISSVHKTKTIGEVTVDTFKTIVV